MTKSNIKIFNIQYLIFLILFLVFSFLFFITPVSAEEEAASSTPENPISVNLNLRYQNQFIFQDAVNLTSSTTFSYTDTADNLTKATSTGPNVLASLLVADATSTAFNISDLQYYPAFNSFYLNCLTLTAPTGTEAGTEACANWNYVVNGIYPSVGMGSYTLSGGEAVYIYFSNPWQITASTSTFPAQTTTTLATWRYNYDSTSTEWMADAGDIIDISIPNPNPTGWWDATITTTTLTTNASGTIDYVFSVTGTYYAKITSPDFSKWSPAVTLTVTEPPVQEEQEDEEDDGDGGNGPIGGVTAEIIPSNVIQEKTRLLLNFLASQQTDDGKIIDGGVTDWAIISFGADNQYAEDIKKGAVSLLDFAKSYNFTDASDLNFCAGYPRHLLAFLAAGVPKENPEILNLKSKINSECYQNHLYGQNGINDDVFALLALLSVDTPISEPLIIDIIATIINDQTADGAFTWAGFASPDITGAAVNALRYAQNKGAAIDQNVLAKAKTYLKAQQLSDGGWGFGSSDALTTSWVVMGINSLGESQTEWTNGAGKNPWSVLVNQLNSDGYYEPSWAPGTIDWFGAKHAAPALLGRPWPIILAPKPAPPAVNNSIGGIGGIASSPTLATSTPPASATSTISLETPLATSTLAIPEISETSEVVNLPNPSQNEPAPSSSSRQEASPSSIVSGTSSGTFSRTTAPAPARSVNSPIPPPSQPLPATIADLPPTFLNPNVLPPKEHIQPPVNPPLPLEQKAATTAVTGSAILLSATSLFLLIRLLLMAV